MEKLNLNIMLVEDHIELNDVLENFLKKFFNSYKIFNDGKEALEFYQENIDKIDLILTDINMPKMNGIEMIRKIREFDSDIKIYVMSAIYDNQYSDDLKRSDINKFFPKPINVIELLQEITNDFK